MTKMYHVPGSPVKANLNTASTNGIAYYIYLLSTVDDFDTDNNVKFTFSMTLFNIKISKIPTQLLEDHHLNLYKKNARKNLIAVEGVQF